MRERKYLINVVCDTNGMVEVAPHQGTATVAREAANSWGVWVQATCGARAYAALTVSLTASFASLPAPWSLLLRRYSVASTKLRDALRMCRLSRPLRSCMTKAQTTWLGVGVGWTVEAHVIEEAGGAVELLVERGVLEGDGREVVDPLLDEECGVEEVE